MTGEAFAPCARDWRATTMNERTVGSMDLEDAINYTVEAGFLRSAAGLRKLHRELNGRSFMEMPNSRRGRRIARYVRDFSAEWRRLRARGEMPPKHRMDWS